ncbi:hypothetical protein GOP47_0017172 [Adiantum capillus-veneris]|uniref:Uncharacterized protein n=1 Tax=Adiantum capillus-veneris TaxID=13818 RepID=A0A9D4ZCD3_ADICA|nr:hypothetical protein GOP47_0017172 [Adiantum capillus-veneris]
MQGVGQLCLDQHVKVHYRVPKMVCSRREIAPTIDVMETGICAICESGVTCKEEDTANLAGDEVWDQIFSCFSNDVVIEQVTEEQVAIDCGDKEALPELVLGHFGQVYDKQEESVCFSMSQSEAKKKVFKVCAMLWMGLVLKDVMQADVHRLKRLLEADHAMEPSLARSSILVSDAGIFQCTQVHFVCGKRFWILVEGICHAKVLQNFILGLAGAKRGLKSYVFQVDGYNRCHIFDPGGAYTMLGRAYGFPFDPGGQVLHLLNLSLSIYCYLSSSCT